MAAAQPGDEIVLAPGRYVATGLVPKTRAHFGSFANGTAEERIVLRSERSDDPAVLVGESVRAGNELIAVLRIYGDYWTV